MTGIYAMMEEKNLESRFYRIKLIKMLRYFFQKFPKNT